MNQTRYLFMDTTAPPFRRIFTLGGYPYTAPERVGVGVFARIQEELIKLFRKHNPGERHNTAVPNPGYNPSVKGSTPTVTRLAQWMEEMEEMGRSTMIDLETSCSALLTPCDGSPSVADGLEIASPEEVTAINSFFTGSEMLSTLAQQQSADRSESTLVTKRTKASSTQKRLK